MADDKAELLSRVELIEQMIASGRQSTESRGWVFILWGVGYLVATGWMRFLPHTELAWPVTMLVFGALTGIGFWMMNRKRKSETEVEHSIGSVWIATGLTFVPVIACAAAYKPNTVPVLIFIILGLANLASGNILKWWPQKIIGGLWWLCAIALANAPEEWMPLIFVLNALVCQIGFGVYLITLEKKELRRG
jgi:hypothetical protein